MENTVQELENLLTWAKINRKFCGTSSGNNINYIDYQQLVIKLCTEIMKFEAAAGKTLQVN